MSVQINIWSLIIGHIKLYFVLQSRNVFLSGFKSIRSYASFTSAGATVA